MSARCIVSVRARPLISLVPSTITIALSLASASQCLKVPAISLLLFPLSLMRACLTQLVIHSEFPARPGPARGTVP